jgi:hypothetical protein
VLVSFSLFFLWNQIFLLSVLVFEFLELSNLQILLLIHFLEFCLLAIKIPDFFTNEMSIHISRLFFVLQYWMYFSVNVVFEVK